jgi:hypothetical protein
MNTQSMKQSTLGGDILAAIERGWATAAAALGTVWMSFPPLFLLLFAMSTLDVLTGVAAAKARGDYERSKVRKGAWLKATVWGGCAAGYLFDRALALGPVELAGFHLVPSFGAALCGVFLLGEFQSNLDHVTESGGGKSSLFRAIVARLKGASEK